MSQYREPIPGTPDSETFSTPPSTPGPLSTTISENSYIQSSLSRMSNKLASLQIDHKPSDWTPDIELQVSPDDTRRANGIPSPAPLSRDYTAVPHAHGQHGAKSAAQHHHLPPPSPSKLPVTSPCFVHSHLDKSAHLTDWLKNKHNAESHDVGVARSLQLPPTTISPAASGFTNGYGYGTALSDDEDEFHGSITKRLAETAVGVREMSKQLGRARVQSNIQNVLIVTKARDNRLIKLTRELALYLMLKHRRGSKRGLVVYVDSQLRNSRRFDAEGIQRDYPALFEPFPRRRTSSNHSVSSLSSSSTTQREESDEGQLRYWTSSMCNHSPHLFDFVVTLGGDGTVLFTSWLFQRIVPPVLPFALGSLGFLTNFDFADHQAVMDSAIDNGIRVNLRMRFTCTVYRSVANEEGKGRKAVKMGETGEIMMKNIEKGGWEALEGGWTGGYSIGDTAKKDKEIMCFTTRPAETFEVLNDLVVDRGQNPYVSLLELFGDEHHMTTVQADGLTVSTPTGSTAYSLSAGGSLVHPEIPAILVTPICPHTLSFRPILLPDSMELRICVPYNSRSTAWASFDGRGRVELKQGDHIKVTASKYPFPTVCADKQSTDWFHAISRTLKWNERERQKSFVVVEEGPPKRPRAHKAKQPSVHTEEGSPEDEEEDEVSDDEAEEEEDPEDAKFDIDDSSPEAATTEKAKKDDPASLMIPDPSVLTKRRAKSRSRSRVRAPPHSGVNSPSRFAGGVTPQYSPPGSSLGTGGGGGPGGSSRHVDFDIPLSGPSSGSTSPASLKPHMAQHGVRDELHAPRSTNGKSRIPTDRDLDLESVKTPTPAALHHRQGGRSRSREQGHRAFAVWGHDESDSNASDSESVGSLH